jgi:hypothetical protein
LFQCCSSWLLLLNFRSLRQSRGGSGEFRIELVNYEKQLAGLSDTAERLERELESTPEVTSLAYWYYGETRDATRKLIEEVDRLLSTKENENNIRLLQNNIFIERWRDSMTGLSNWMNKRKEILLGQKRHYEAMMASQQQ